MELLFSFLLFFLSFIFYYLKTKNKYFQFFSIGLYISSVVLFGNYLFVSFFVINLKYSLIYKFVLIFVFMLLREFVIIKFLKKNNK